MKKQRTSETDFKADTKEFIFVMVERRSCIWVILSLCILGVSASDVLENTTEWETSGLSYSTDVVKHQAKSNHSCHKEHTDGIHLVSFRWQEVGIYFTVTFFVIVAGFTKLGFHHLHWLSNTIPESCVLVVLGAALGLIVFFTREIPLVGECPFNIPLPQFTADLFFFVLLPPIVLESAYSLHDRAFFDNLGTVLVYAVIGTMFNIFAIGPTIYGLATAGAMGNFTITMGESLVFSSLISAVDPVAVLVIFQELGVNKDLYFLVFGESLLNDGVTVVIYNTMNTFLFMESIPAAQYALAVVAFIVVVFGGILIGIAFGCLTAVITKSTTDVRVVEPLAMLGLSYLCYLTAELFHFSGIISLIACGLVQAQYAFQNISQKSYTCVKYFTKMASATSDTIIFMFLGMVLVSDRHVWHTGFVLWTVGLCLIFRFIGVILLTGFMNQYRIKKIGIEEQFIAAYGGLRGAVAFSLVEMLDEALEPRPIFVTTTLVVILFTIFVQGITIKPLVNFLQIQRRTNDRKNLNEEINNTSMDHIMAGVEEILGQHGDFYLRAVLIYYNDRYLKKWFVRPCSESKLQRLFEKIAISEHYAHLYGPVAMIEDKVKPICHTDKIQAKLVRAASLSPSFKDEVLLEPGLMIEEDEDAELVQDGVQLRKKKTKRKGSMAIFPSRHSTRRVGASERTLSDTYPNHPNQTQVENDEELGDEGASADDFASHRRSTLALRKAFRDNPYNKLHYKYNRNLVGEEDQEMSEHLERRHLNARRMSSLATSSISGASQSMTQFARIRTESEGGTGSRLSEGVAELRDRHQRRRHTMAVRRRNNRDPESSGSLSSPLPLPPPVTLQTLQETSPPESSDAIFPESPKESRPTSRRSTLDRDSSKENEEVEVVAMLTIKGNDSDSNSQHREEEV